MTKRERAQVVELLRCAADVSSIVRAGYALGRCDGVNPCSKAYSLAWDAYRAVATVSIMDSYYAHPSWCLEAAARCEEGSWP